MATSNRSIAQVGASASRRTAKIERLWLNDRTLQMSAVFTRIAASPASMTATTHAKEGPAGFQMSSRLPNAATIHSAAASERVICATLKAMRRAIFFERISSAALTRATRPSATPRGATQTSPILNVQVAVIPPPSGPERHSNGFNSPIINSTTNSPNTEPLWPSGWTSVVLARAMVRTAAPAAMTAPTNAVTTRPRIRFDILNTSYRSRDELQIDNRLAEVIC